MLEYKYNTHTVIAHFANSANSPFDIMPVPVVEDYLAIENEEIWLQKLTNRNI